MPCSSPTWARIGHDQALRGNLTGPAPHPSFIYSADARTRRYDRLRRHATGRSILARRPSMRTLGAEVVRGRWRWSVIGRSPTEPLAVGGVAVLPRCIASGRPVKPLVLSVQFSAGFAGPDQFATGPVSRRHEALAALRVRGLPLLLQSLLAER